MKFLSSSPNEHFAFSVLSWLARSYPNHRMINSQWEVSIDLDHLIIGGIELIKPLDARMIINKYQ